MWYKMRMACLTVLGVFGLVACSYESFSEVDALNEAQAVGSPFTQQLTSEYRELSNYLLKVGFDYPDALHFARKGLAAAVGDVVMPEAVVDWNLLPEHIEVLGTARGRLLVAFDLGAREIEPVLAAIAQARFDCWIEKQEENWQMDKILACKNQFMETMAELEARLGLARPQMVEAPPPPPEVAPMAVPPLEPMPVEEAMYLVFFDWDSDKIGSGGLSVIDAVGNEVKGRLDTLKRINVVGHTDTSGSAAYNRRLGMRRANAVRDALVERGIDPAIIRVESRGQDDLLVQTGANVREPANRRANISFE